jgi:phage baseplate assembly protein W
MDQEIRGMSFPFRIDPVSGRVAMSEGRTKIQQNVRLILGTRIGERPMLRDFGTRLPSLVHEPNTGRVPRPRDAAALGAAHRRHEQQGRAAGR